MLTDEQRKQRAGCLTASRIAPLMTGDPQGIMQLYREMIGEVQEENLDRVWPARLGQATEDLNLDWYEEENSRLLTMRRQFVIHPERDWAGATLDGFDPVLGCPIECKHTGGHEPMDIVIHRYQPQCHWQMFVTRTDQCALSVIMGAAEPKVTFVPRDWDYMNVMIKRAERFMYHVGMRTPPVEIAPPVGPPAWDNLKPYDMTGNNNWANNAATFLNYKSAHESYEDAKETLKHLMPADASRATGYGVVMSRNRAGHLYVRKDKAEG